MATAAILERLTWRPATLESVRHETSTARALTFIVPGWSGHTAGQHVDLRLTAPDGYMAMRPYSIGSAPSAEAIKLTVELHPGGEVSSFLTQVASPGMKVEVRGPLGGWFAWSPALSEPVQLVAGGSGVVPLVSMLRAHRAVRHPSPMRLLYSLRTPDSTLYARELSAWRPQPQQVNILYSRRAPAGNGRPPGRLNAADLRRYAIPADQQPLCYVCGPTPFVETAIGLLLDHGHEPSQIRAERFGVERT